MKNLLLSALILASALQAVFGEQDGDWTYTVSNNQATITGYTGSSETVTIPSSLGGHPVIAIGNGVFAGRKTLTSAIIPEGVETIGDSAFLMTSISEITLPQSVRHVGRSAFIKYIETYWDDPVENWVDRIGPLDSITMPERLSSLLASMTWYERDEELGWGWQKVYYLLAPKKVTLTSNGSQYINNADFINALANNDTFVTAVANKIKETSGNYGLATQSGLSSAIEPLATKTQITTAINEGKSAGIASVTASPNTWSLFTSSQIQNMAIGDLVLTKEVNGNFVLNYDIEQSDDLANWTVYSANTQIVKLPADKAFVRIKAKQ